MDYKYAKVDFKDPKILYIIGMKKIALLEIITTPEEYARMCYRITNIMTRAGDYKDAPELAEKYANLAAETMDQAKQERYDAAMQILQNAKTVADYDRGLKILQELKTFRDAREKFVSYREIKKNYIKKSNIIRAVQMAILAGIVIVVFIFGGKYIDKKDQERLEKLEEKQTEEVKPLQEALNEAEIGDQTISFGAYKWMLLDKDDESALLICMDVEHYPELSIVPVHDVLEPVTWEQSTLRAWLNQDFLSEQFTQEERDQILVTDVVNSKNSVYGTSSGADTKDQAFLLSEQEAEQYWDLLKKVKCNWMLRTSGHEENAIAFVSSDHHIRPYGCAVTDGFYVRPAIRVVYTPIEETETETKEE